MSRGAEASPHAEVTSPAARPDQEWFERPWRERVQASDVAIAGLVFVVLLVGGLAFFLDSPSVPAGSKPLALSQARPPRPRDPPEQTSFAAGRGSPSSSKGRTQAASTSTTASVSPASTTTVGATTPGDSRTSTTSSPRDAAGAPARPQNPVSATSPGPCTPADLSITTTTDQPSYQLGSSVTITTELVDHATCVFAPVASGAYSCPTTVVVTTPLGTQVYPYPSQGEQCAAITGGTLRPGAVRDVTIVWSQAPLGEYAAVGTWSWGSPASPYQVSAQSPTFTVTP